MTAGTNGTTSNNTGTTGTTAGAQTPQIPRISCLLAPGCFDNYFSSRPTDPLAGNGLTGYGTDTRVMPWSRGKNGQQNGYGNQQSAAQVAAIVELTNYSANMLQCLQNAK